MEGLARLCVFYAALPLLSSRLFIVTRLITSAVTGLRVPSSRIALRLFVTRRIILVTCAVDVVSSRGL